MNTTKNICVIGGCNMDIVGFPKDVLVRKDSNLGSVHLSPGGVGRNIAENIALLGLKVDMFSAVGNDVNGDAVTRSTENSGVNMTYVRKVDFPTGTYLAVLDENMDMDIAINSMEILKFIDIDYVNSHYTSIMDSDVIVIDANLHYETFKYIVETFRNKVLFLDTVSTIKASRIKEFIGCFHTIKPNKLESETLTGIKITDLNSLKKSSDFYHERGVVNVCISMGPDGVYYSDGVNQGIVKAKFMLPKNATGAGDAFQAGLVYSYINEFSIIDSVKFSTGAAIMAMSSEETINKNINIESIKEFIKDLEVITND